MLRIGGMQRDRAGRDGLQRADVSEEDTWLVTYEITGDEDGPAIGTLELTGTMFTADEEDLSTRSSSTKIGIKVTDVTKVGVQSLSRDVPELLRNFTKPQIGSPSSRR
jgi:hypothetical protein